MPRNPASLTPDLIHNQGQLAPASQVHAQPVPVPFWHSTIWPSHARVAVLMVGCCQAQGTAMPAYLISYDLNGEPVAVRFPQTPVDNSASHRIGRHVEIKGRPANRPSETPASPVVTAPLDEYLPVAA